MRKRVREIEFDVDAYTARLIGRENVSKLEGAVLEIVKNAYDADANVCCLYYSNTEECVYIMDNGCGMKEEVLRTHWMTIGNSSKKVLMLQRMEGYKQEQKELAGLPWIVCPMNVICLRFRKKEVWSGL